MTGHQTNDTEFDQLLDQSSVGRALPQEVELASDLQELRARMLAPMLTWTEVRPDDPRQFGVPVAAGDIGGSQQVSEAWSRAWTASLPNGLFARIEIAFYVGDAPAPRSTEYPLEAELSIWEQTEYLVCRDLADPGGTEVNAVYTYDRDADRPGYLRPIEASAQHLCAQLTTRDIQWPREGDPLRLLAEGLPPVTEYPSPGNTATRLFIGRVPIGTLTEFSVDPYGYSPRYFVQVHDWNNGADTPTWDDPGIPGQTYDPLDIGAFVDPASAIRHIVTEVPSLLSHEEYSIPTKEVQTMPVTPEQDAAEDAAEQAASEALLTGAPSADAVETWCDLTLCTPEEDDTRQAIELVTGKTNPDVLLTVAADLYSTNPDAATLRDLSEIEYVEVVLGMAKAEAMDTSDARRAAGQLRRSLTARLGSREEAASYLWERLSAEAQATMGVADPHRFTHDDMEAIEAYATGADGVGVAETGDGYWLVYDESV